MDNSVYIYVQDPSITDSAKPVAKSSQCYDNNTNGLIDQCILQISESLDDNDSNGSSNVNFTAVDASTSGSITISSVDITGSTVYVNFNESSSTDGVINLSYDGSQGGHVVEDYVSPTPNQADNFTNLALRALPPAVYSATLQNSTMTSVDLVLSGHSFYTFYDSGTTIASANGLNNISYKSIHPTSGTINSSTTITLTFPISLSTDVSGEFVMGANDLLNGSVPNDLVDFSSGITDSAKPVLISSACYDNNNSDGHIDLCTLTFSENFTDNDGSGNPTNWSAANASTSQAITITNVNISSGSTIDISFDDTDTDNYLGVINLTYIETIAEDQATIPNLLASFSNVPLSAVDVPTVTVEQDGGQADPTPNPSALFNVTFSEIIATSTFTSNDIIQNGTISSSSIIWTITDTGDQQHFTLQADFATTSSGTIIPSIAAGAVLNTIGIGNEVSTASDNSVTYSPSGPTITAGSNMHIDVSGCTGNPGNSVCKISDVAIFTWDNSTTTGDGTANAGETITSVTGNLSLDDGTSTQIFYDDGTYGDATSSDDIYTYAFTFVPGTYNDTDSHPVQFAITATDSYGNVTNSDALSNGQAIDDIRPYTSVHRDSPVTQATNASVLHFRADFSENVRENGGDLTAASFAIATTGNITADALTDGNITSAGNNTYYIQVNGVSGIGTVGINFIASSSVIDTAGNATVDNNIGETYTVNQGAPLALSAHWHDLNENAIVDAGDTVTVIFSQAMNTGTIDTSNLDTNLGISTSSAYTFGSFEFGTNLSWNSNNEILAITLGSNVNIETGTTTITPTSDLKNSLDNGIDASQSAITIQNQQFSVTVDDDFTSTTTDFRITKFNNIQEAIDAVGPTSTVTVNAGLYGQGDNNIIIDNHHTGLQLLGAGRDATFIAFNPGADVFIQTSGVTVDGFDITNGLPFSTVTPGYNGHISNVTNSSQLTYTLRRDLASSTITITNTGGASDSNSPHYCLLNSGARTAGNHTLDLSEDCANNVSNLVNGAVYNFNYYGTDNFGNTPPSVDVGNITFDASAPQNDAAGSAVRFSADRPAVRVNSNGNGEHITNVAVIANNLHGGKNGIGFGWNNFPVSYSTISYNNIYDNGGNGGYRSGIIMDGGGHNTIEYNNVYDNGDISCLDCTSAGILIWGYYQGVSGANTIRYNNVHNNINHGIRIQGNANDSAFGNIISNNTVADNGLEVNGHNNSGTAGIQLIDNYAQVIDNTITGNDYQGIRIGADSSANNTLVKNNIISGNAFYGIRIFSGSNSTIVGNQIMGNGTTTENAIGIGLYNRTGNTVDATHNWWGTTDGPRLITDFLGTPVISGGSGNAIVTENNVNDVNYQTFCTVSSCPTTTTRHGFRPIATSTSTTPTPGGGSSIEGNFTSGGTTTIGFTGSGTTTSPSGTAPYQFSFTKILKLGFTGDEVKQLQIFLNIHGFPVSKTGNGSLGKETNYFGPKTKQALIKFQEANLKDILTPQNLKKGTGLFGIYTKKVINRILLEGK